MHQLLQTERLNLRPLSIADAPFILELVNTPDWLRNIGDRKVRTVEDAVAYLENGPVKSYAANGFGMYLVSLKENDRPIGMCGIIRRAELEHPDIGFALMPGYCGQGYGFEMASATLRYAHEELGLPVICAITLPSNIPSVRLIQKIGLVFQNNITSPPTGDELQLYATPVYGKQ